MEDGGCAVLFRSPRSRLLGVPNALLGIALYALIAIGLVLKWDARLLFAMTLPAIAMSAFLGYSLLTRGLQCRICWTGHLANAVLTVTLALLAFHLKVDATSLFQVEVPLFAESRIFRLQAEDPDALYKQRENLARAQQAEGIWAARLARDPKDFESAWKLARARYWLGGHAEESRRKPYLENGIAAARAAIAAAPDKPAGHFWTAANMGALAESFGLRQGLKYRGDIKDALETVLRLDPAYQQGSADRALGRWYYKVPGMFGGSNKKSEAHLRKSLTYDPDNAASLYFLAETLIDLGRKDEARSTLQRLAETPVNPEWAPEDREFKLKGNNLLQRMR